MKLLDILQDNTIDRQKMYIGGGVLGAIIVCAALWFGLKGCSDDDINVQLLQAQPAYWNKFVSPRSVAPIYEQPDINHILGRTDQSCILPVLNETQSFYKVYMGAGREGWVKKNQWKDIAFDPIKPEMLSDILLNGQRLDRKSLTYNGGDLENLTLCYYRDFSYEGHLEVAILDNGRLIRPQFYSIDAVAVDKRGFTVSYSDSGKPKIEFGTNYQIDEEGSFAGFLDISKLSKKQIVEIWKAAQGYTPNKVLVSYYFPSQKAIRFYDIDLNVYGVDVKSDKGQVAEGNTGLSGFTYGVEGQYNSDFERIVYHLNAVTPTGEKVNTEIADFAFELTLLAQGDYDGDGEQEAIVYEWGGGNSLQPPYLVYYDKEEEAFKKVEGFEDIYENPEIKIEEWNGQTSFVTTVGLRHDRYIYSNHNLTIAERIMPDVAPIIATITLEEVFGRSPSDESEDRSIKKDIDGDGIEDVITFHHDGGHYLNWGKNMILVSMEADYWFSPDQENGNLGAVGHTFSFLRSEDGHGEMPDILCDYAWLYKAVPGGKYELQNKR